MSFIRERATQQLIDRMLHTSDNVPAIEALYDLVEENLGYRLFRAIEAAKIRLSTREATRIEFDEARIQHRRADHARRVRALLRAAARRRSTPAPRGLLDARGGSPPTRIDAVFLTGGSSQIPAVRRLFAERFGEARLRTADAFTSVAEGLGRSAGAR